MSSHGLMLSRTLHIQNKHRCAKGRQDKGLPPSLASARIPSGRLESAPTNIFHRGIASKTRELCHVSRFVWRLFTPFLTKAVNGELNHDVAGSTGVTPPTFSRGNGVADDGAGWLVVRAHERGHFSQHQHPRGDGGLELSRAECGRYGAADGDHQRAGLFDHR